MKLFQRLINLAKKLQSMPTKLVLSGKEINLTSDNTIIKSNNFNVDKNGNMSCNNAQFLGGKVLLQGGTKGKSNFTIEDSNDDETNTEITPSNIFLKGNNGGLSINAKSNTNGHALVYCDDTGGGITLGGNTSRDISLRAGVNPKITCYGTIYATEYTGGSLKSIKKNIKKINTNATELIKNADICSYNLKSEKKGTKKHIGLVIGEGYNCPDEVISENGQGVEQYSMTSVAWKAIQELIKKDEEKDKQILELTERLKKLEAIINEKN